MRDLTQQVDKIALAERFGRAAAVYDHYAQLQQHVGQSLLALVYSMILTPFSQCSPLFPLIKIRLLLYCPTGLICTFWGAYIS